MIATATGCKKSIVNTLKGQKEVATTVVLEAVVVVGCLENQGVSFPSWWNKRPQVPRKSLIPEFSGLVGRRPAILPAATLPSQKY